MRAALVISIAAALAVSGRAQNRPPPPPRSTQPIVIGGPYLRLVVVPVTVADSGGQFLNGLEARDFHVLVDGVEQKIETFDRLEGPAQVLILIEESSASNRILKDHLAAFEALLAGLAPDDPVALATYSDTPKLVFPLTVNKSSAIGAIEALNLSDGSAEINLDKSLSASLDWLAGPSWNKAIILLATGLDTSQGRDWPELERRLQKSWPLVYPVALGESLSKPPIHESPEGTSFPQGDALLRKIAELSGGTAYFPQEPTDFQTILSQIANAVHRTYVLGFIPPSFDGREHTISVVVTSVSPGIKVESLHVQFRHSYFAPAAPTPATTQ